MSSSSKYVDNLGEVMDTTSEAFLCAAPRLARHPDARASLEGVFADEAGGWCPGPWEPSWASWLETPNGSDGPGGPDEQDGPGSLRGSGKLEEPSTPSGKAVRVSMVGNGVSASAAATPAAAGTPAVPRISRSRDLVSGGESDPPAD